MLKHGPETFHLFRSSAQNLSAPPRLTHDRHATTVSLVSRGRPGNFSHHRRVFCKCPIRQTSWLQFAPSAQIHEKNARASLMLSISCALFSSISYLAESKRHMSVFNPSVFSRLRILFLEVYFFQAHTNCIP